MATRRRVKATSTASRDEVVCYERAARRLFPRVRRHEPCGWLPWRNRLRCRQRYAGCRGWAGIRETRTVFSAGASVEFNGCLVRWLTESVQRARAPQYFRSSMAWERTCLFAMYLGQMDRQLDAVLRHVKTRRQFGQLLHECRRLPIRRRYEAAAGSSAAAPLSGLLAER